MEKFQTLLWLLNKNGGGGGDLVNVLITRYLREQ